MIITQALAQTNATQQAGIFEMLFPLIMIFGIVYLFIIRPQNKRQKQHKELLDNLKKGDVVITQGGLIGKVTNISETDNEVTIDLGDSVKVSIVKQMILTVKENKSDFGPNAVQAKPKAKTKAKPKTTTATKTKPKTKPKTGKSK